MFYILNQDNQIVAADYDLLEILEANDLQTLLVKVANGEVSFENIDDRKVNIQSSNSLVRASHEEFTLKTPFGDLTLVKLYNIIVKSRSQSVMDDSFQTHRESEPKADVRPKRASIFLDDDKQEKVQPKRASIFLDDEEEMTPTPTPKESVVQKVADIPNEKVQEDLALASQIIKETKVDKKPVLETLRIEEEELPLSEESPIEEKLTIAEEEIKEEELTLSIEEEPQESSESLMIDESEVDEDTFADDLKLAGIDLEEKEEDEASVDELLALASEQNKEIHPHTQEDTLEIQEDEDTLGLDDILLEDDAKPAEEPSLLLSDDEPEFSSEIDEGLLIADDEEPKKKEPVEESESIEDLLLLDDDEPEEELVVEEPKKIEEEVEEFEDLLLLDDDKEETVSKEEAPMVEEVDEIEDLLLFEDETPKVASLKEESPQVVEEVEEFDDLLLLDDDKPKASVAKEEPLEEVEEFDDLLLLDDEKPKEAPKKEEPKEDVTEIQDLLLEIEEEPKELIKEEAPKVVKKPIQAYDYPDTIEIDLDEYGEMIGLGGDDYKEFLNEFIDKSIIYDENLRSQEKDAREEALDELSSISQSLQLPYLQDILEDMLDRDYLEEELVDIYFDCLAKVTTKSAPKVEVTTQLSEDTSLQEPKEEVKQVIKEEPKEEAPAVNPNGYGTLSFEGIKPIHFDFRLEEAAEDLSLPVDLIEEFVNDFIEQAIEEKETFIKAYADGDMDAIQKTGHKLKGASSNLRIIPLSETLEEIQHCETPARFEPLLKKYWGQFLSFKLFMENISH